MCRIRSSSSFIAADERPPKRKKSDASDIDFNTSNNVTPMLTDMYNITMAYGHWVHGRADVSATFELFFRKNPFGGEYTVFAGLEAHGPAHRALAAGAPPTPRAPRAGAGVRQVHGQLQVHERARAVPPPAARRVACDARWVA